MIKQFSPLYNCGFFVVWSSIRRAAHVVKSILVVVNAVDDLLVDEFSGDLVKTRVVPGREQLLAVEQPPRAGTGRGRVVVPRLGTANELFTLGDGVHDVVKSAAQR